MPKAHVAVEHRAEDEAEHPITNCERCGVDLDSDVFWVHVPGPGGGSMVFACGPCDRQLRVEAGSRLILARRARRLTQAQVADHVGVHKSQVSRWERGLAVPAAPARPLLAALFDLDIDLIPADRRLVPAPLSSFRVNYSDGRSVEYDWGPGTGDGMTPQERVERLEALVAAEFAYPEGFPVAEGATLTTRIAQLEAGVRRAHPMAGQIASRRLEDRIQAMEGVMHELVDRVGGTPSDDERAAWAERAEQVAAASVAARLAGLEADVRSVHLRIDNLSEALSRFQAHVKSVHLQLLELTRAGEGRRARPKRRNPKKTGG